VLVPIVPARYHLMVGLHAPSKVIEFADLLFRADAIRHSSQALKPISAQALLNASIQVPTLSEIRSRISMLDGASKEQQSQQAAVATAKEKPADQKQHRPSNSHMAPAATPVSSSAAAGASPFSLLSPLVRPIDGVEPLPPYALLQPAPLTAVNRRLASTLQSRVLSFYLHFFSIILYSFNFSASGNSSATPTLQPPCLRKVDGIIDLSKSRATQRRFNRL
jgi:hypothetical protein